MHYEMHALGMDDPMYNILRLRESDTLKCGIKPKKGQQLVISTIANTQGGALSLH